MKKHHSRLGTARPTMVLAGKLGASPIGGRPLSLDWDCLPQFSICIGEILPH